MPEYLKPWRNKMRSITCQLVEKDVVGDLEITDIDLQRSKINFLIDLDKILSSTFSCAVDVSFANHRLVLVDDILSNPAVSYVNTVIEKVIQDKKWVVTNSVLNSFSKN